MQQQQVEQGPDRRGHEDRSGQPVGPRCRPPPTVPPLPTQGGGAGAGRGEAGRVGNGNRIVTLSRTTSNVIKSRSEVRTAFEAAVIGCEFDQAEMIKMARSSRPRSPGG